MLSKVLLTLGGVVGLLGIIAILIGRWSPEHLEFILRMIGVGVVMVIAGLLTMPFV